MLDAVVQIDAEFVWGMGWEGVEADERVEEDVVCVCCCLSVEAVACDGFCATLLWWRWLGLYRLGC